MEFSRCSITIPYRGETDQPEYVGDPQRPALAFPQTGLTRVTYLVPAGAEVDEVDSGHQ